MRNCKTNRGGVTALVLAALISFTPISAWADDDYSSPNDNVHVHFDALAQLKYGKVLDMSSAADRSVIPDADFSFVVEEIPDDKSYGIGTTYGVVKDDNGNIMFTGPTVKKGQLSKKPYTLSSVSFSKDDKYFPEIETTRNAFFHFYSLPLPDRFDATHQEKVDYVTEKIKIELGLFNSLLKYAYGEMRSDNGTHTIYFRPPTPAELVIYDRMPGNKNNWPRDTIGWRCFRQYPDEEWSTAGSYDRGDELLWDYDYNTLDVIKKFNYRVHRFVPYWLQGFHRSIILDRVMQNGLYKSIRKPILGFNDQKRFIKDILPHRSPFVDDGTRVIYRFVLREKSADSRFSPNTETKILDLIDSVDFDNPFILLFDSVQQADEHYKKCYKIAEDKRIDFVIDQYVALENAIYRAPYVNFHNGFIPTPPPAKSYPMTGDGTHTVLYGLALLAALTGLVMIRFRKRKFQK